jgi:multiple sugar transport system permease protein
MATLSSALSHSEDSPRWQFEWRELIWHIPLLIFALILFYPFIWMLLSSFKTTAEVLAIPPTLLPQTFTTNGYSEIFEIGSVGRNFLNTVIVALSGTILSAIMSSLGGFVFAKYDFWGRRFFFFCMISQMMIPVAVTILPLFTLMSRTGLLNTYTALILPVSMSGFGIFLMRQFMQGLPNEMFEAARIDGATDWQMYSKIALPLTRSSLAGVGVFTFLFIWNQFYWPLVIISKPEMRTMTQAIVLAASSIGQRYDVLAAGATISVLPIIIVFGLAMRQVVASVVFTGSKEG